MKTPYNEIVNIASIGSQTNPISLNSFCILPLFLIFIKKLQIYYTQKTYLPQ